VKIGWIAYVVPFVFVFQPSVLFRGHLWTGLWEIATACFGVVLGTAALVGHAKGQLAAPWRAAAAFAALLLFLPAETLPGAADLTLTLGSLVVSSGLLLNVAGVVFGAAIFILEARRVRAAA
jgi:TRAP-type uncharacterized transport system fused permease subunit